MLTWDNAYTNIVFDGNSIMAGSSDGTATNADRIGEQMLQLAPISGAMTYTNLALSGQTWRKMNGLDGGSLTDVHGAYQAGKQNLLFIMEAVNTATTARPVTGAQCTDVDIISDCRDYINSVKAVHPDWRIYILTAPAYQDDQSPGPGPANAAIDGFNAYVRANYLSMGVEGYVETRVSTGPLPYQPPYLYGSFVPSGYFQDGVHPNPAGEGVIAQYMADKLKVIPAVAPPAPGKRHVASGGRPLMIGGRPLLVS